MPAWGRGWAVIPAGRRLYDSAERLKEMARMGRTLKDWPERANAAGRNETAGTKEGRRTQLVGRRAAGGRKGERKKMRGGLGMTGTERTEFYGVAHDRDEIADGYKAKLG